MNSLGLSLSLLCLVACVYAVDKPYEIGARPTEEPRPPEDYLPMPRMLNDVVDIKVNCDVEANTMTVNIAFERPFEGALFAKGNYKVEQCRVTATPGSKETVLVLPLDGCGVALDQAGEGYDARTFYNSTVIVMAEFAWGILEMGDRAYDVSCRFGGTQIDTLEFNMQVPNISPNTVTSSPITFSSCNMKIVQGRNPLVTSVNVLDLGDIATLVFWVDNQGVFDLSVFDCYAHDGMQMSRLELVDEAGCPAHKKVIGFTQRSTALSPGHTYVYAHFKAFKFPDIDNVFFTCQCRVCFDHCYAPDCDDNRKKREATSTSDDNKAKVVDADGREYNMGDSVDEQLMAETIYVRVPSVDSVMYDEETGEMLKLRHKAVTIGDLCVNRMTFIAGISACVVLLFFGFLAAAVCHARSRRSQKTATNTVDNFGFAGKF